MNLPLHIAKRYLFSKKTHNAINVISMVSVFGVAIAVAALICTMSVYNGFQRLLGGMYSDFDPQLKIKVVEGKTFKTNNKTFEAIRKDNNVDIFCEMLEENALAQYKDAQTSATIMGVSDNFGQLTNMKKVLCTGRFALNEYDINYATIGIVLARTLNTGNSFIDPVTIYAPKRLGNINMLNPAGSFKTSQILLSGTFDINQPDYDKSLIIVPIAFARDLFEYTNEVTAVGIKLKEGANTESTKKHFAKLLGSSYTVQNVMEQKADFYRINRVEKWMTFLILSFILLIALFNVIGSLSMLILEKKKDAQTLSELGADARTIRRVFLYEGRMIAFSGAILGIIIGVLLCFLQQHFGLLKLGGGGNYIVDAYPVRLVFKDVVLVLFTVLIVSIPSTWWPIKAYFNKKNDQET